ncbi:MAG: T9SS type A sorting domain-containing protein, partial [Bacteroidetes bacterium]|nr:T9SS type A sorting domain-containing protein [Bacteroidota bacterium]
ILNITQSKDIVSIEEEANNNVLIYPNPVNDVLHINSTSFANSYEMYSIYGQRVLAGKINGHEAQINVTSLPSGIYSLRMISGEKVVTKCFIHR